MIQVVVVIQLTWIESWGVDSIGTLEKQRWRGLCCRGSGGLWDGEGVRGMWERGVGWVKERWLRRLSSRVGSSVGINVLKGSPSVSFTHRRTHTHTQCHTDQMYPGCIESVALTWRPANIRDPPPPPISNLLKIHFN